MKITSHQVVNYLVGNNENDEPYQKGKQDSALRFDLGQKKLVKRNISRPPDSRYSSKYNQAEDELIMRRQLRSFVEKITKHGSVSRLGWEVFAPDPCHVE
jgi:hypothetical protein